MPHTYIPFYFFSYLILALVLLPLVIPLGRILPMGYAFLRKDPRNYGNRCGTLYFINTMGTFFGAVVLSYLFLHFLDINHIYLTNIFIFLAIYLALVTIREKKPWPVAFATCVLAVTLLYQWDRDIHIFGNFRNRNYDPQQNRASLFSTLKLQEHHQILDFKDGPNTTAGVLKFNPKNQPSSLSIMVNGKSDSSTGGDFSTTTFLALVPYLNQYHNGPLKTSVVGLGTGITVGVLAQLKRVREVDVLEISSAVRDMNHFFDPYNYAALKNPKVRVHIIDAFKFYVKNSKKYHIIISEPTNPWVTGVENLYTPYFYQLAKRSLTPDGVLAQWMHTYSIDKKIFNTVIKNMEQSFPVIRAYRTAKGDLLLLGQSKPGRLSTDIMSSPDGPLIQELLQLTSIPELPLINYLEVMSPKDSLLTFQIGESYDHGILNPTLSFKALRPFFTGQGIGMQDLLNPSYARQVSDHARAKRFKRMASLLEQDPEYCVRALKKLTRSPLCQIYKDDLDHYNNFLNAQKLRPSTLASYNHLRNRGIIRQDAHFLSRIEKDLIQRVQKKKLDPESFKVRIKSLWAQMERDGLWRELFGSIEQVHTLQLVNQEQYREILDLHRKRQKEITANLAQIFSHFAQWNARSNASKY